MDVCNPQLAVQASTGFPHLNLKKREGYTKIFTAVKGIQAGILVSQGQTPALIIHNIKAWQVNWESAPGDQRGKQPGAGCQGG